MEQRYRFVGPRACFQLLSWGEFSGKFKVAFIAFANASGRKIAKFAVIAYALVAQAQLHPLPPELNVNLFSHATKIIGSTPNDVVKCDTILCSLK